jgi:serine/threonine protein kinase
MRCPHCSADNRDDSRFCHQCATPLPTPVPGTPPPDSPTLIAAFENLTRGTLFAGRYEIIEELGKGGMGSVYKAFDQKLQEVVALKIIRPELGFNAAAVERFKTELKNARKIAHRHVCRLYDLGEAGLVQFISMEYVEGEDLKKFIRRAGPIGAGRAVAIARQVAEGLAEAHRMGVIHRDLKPQNIMVDRDGRARIMDFGLSRFLESEGMTGTGVMLGTPEYMSPEQVELRDIDARSDLYAMGVILFEMVTGHVPFEGQTPLAVAIKHKSEPPPDARETNPLVPEPLVRIIYRCLEKDPGKRFQSADELAEALAALEKDMPSIVREISKSEFRPAAKTPPPAAPKPRRPRTVRYAAAAVLFLLVLGPPTARILFKRPSAKNLPSVKADGKAVYVSETPRDPQAPPAGRDRGFRISLPSLDAENMREAFDKFLKSADPNDLDNAEKVVGVVKGFLPQKGPAVDAYNKLAEEIRNRRNPDRSRPAGPPRSGSGNPSAAASGSAAAKDIKGDMQKLLAVVAEREAALAAKAAMEKAKDQARRAGTDDRNLLFRLARYEEGNAVEAAAKNDFSGAKALYKVLEKTYTMSPGCTDESACAASLRVILSQFKAETAGLPPSAVDPWLVEYARETENQAQAFLTKREIDNAGGAYLRAAFLYEKIKASAAPAGAR